MRLPRKLFAMLCHYAEPQVFGLAYGGYDGLVHLHVVDPQRFQQTLWAMQESVTSGNTDQIQLLWLLQRALSLSRIPM